MLEFAARKGHDALYDGSPQTPQAISSHRKVLSAACYGCGGFSDALRAMPWWTIVFDTATCNPKVARDPVDPLASEEFMVVGSSDRLVASEPGRIG